MKHRFLIVILSLAFLASCQTESNPPTVSFPNLDRVSTVSVGYHNATIVDTISYHNDDVIIKLYYSTDSAIGANSTQGSVMSIVPDIRTEGDKTIITTLLNNLTDNTIYYYAYGFVSPYNEKYRNGIAAVYTKRKSFVTLKNDAPYIKTDTVTNIGFYKANLTVEKVSDNSDSKPTEWGVCYSETSNVTVNDTKLKTTSTDDGLMAFPVTTLKSGTTYYYRAYGINKYGTSYGEEKSFTTISVNVMTLETSIPTEKGSNYAILTGSVTSNTTGLRIKEKGFYLSSQSNDPTENDMTITSEVAGEGSYQCAVSNLSTYTTYYVRTYAICQYGKLYGNVIAFTTEH